MKKALFAVVALVLVFSGCKKYEDGPSLSLRTKKARLTNVWVIHSVSENGTDKTSDYMTVYAGYTLTINKDNTYSLAYRFFNATDYSENGTWVFSGDKEHVYFTKANTSTQSDWTILKLKERELWGSYTYQDSNNNTILVEAHLTPKYE